MLCVNESNTAETLWKLHFSYVFFFELIKHSCFISVRQKQLNYMPNSWADVWFFFSSTWHWEMNNTEGSLLFRNPSCVSLYYFWRTSSHVFYVVCFLLSFASLWDASQRKIISLIWQWCYLRCYSQAVGTHGLQSADFSQKYSLDFFGKKSKIFFLLTL